MTTQRELGFPALASELTPQCEAIVAQYEDRRSALLPIVHLFQTREGFVSSEAMRFAADFLGLTPAVVESTVSFYTLFYRRPVGKYVLQVCRGLSCTLNGAEDVMASFRERLGVGHLQTTGDGLISYEEVECLASCDRPTCIQVNLEFAYDVTPQAVDGVVAAIRDGSYGVAPMAQTERPGKTWAVRQDTEISDGEKMPGDIGVPDPNNAGGLGDRTGVIALDRIVNNDAALIGRSRERVVEDAAAIDAALGGNTGPSTKREHAGR